MNDLPEWTLDKLDFRALQQHGLVGRAQEVAVLKDRLEELLLPPKQETDNSGNCNRKLILLQGYSGVGKTALALSFTSHPCFDINASKNNKGTAASSSSSSKPKQGLLVRGKFDLQRRNRNPYVGIAAACAEICGALLDVRRHGSNLAANNADTDTIPAAYSTDPSATESQYDTICRQFQTELSSDQWELLLQVVPVLAEFMDYVNLDDSSTSSTSSSFASPFSHQKPCSSSSSSTNNNHATARNTVDCVVSKSRFQFAFLQFVRIPAEHLNLVWVLDDLQWASGPSLELLKLLMGDHTATATASGDSKSNSSNQLMIVGIYRSNEVDETHILHRTVAELRTKSRGSHGAFGMIQLEIGNLELPAVHSTIRTLLALEDNAGASHPATAEKYQRSLQLAHVCHQKTQGNVFFLLQCIEMLHRQELLHFNFGSMACAWKEKEIEASTQASDNVVDLLQAKMRNKFVSSNTGVGVKDNDKQHLMEILKLASCLGSTFQCGILRLVWEQLHTDANRKLQKDATVFLTNGIGSLEKNGYILVHRLDGEDSFDQMSCSWTHDKIHEAASSLISANKIDTFCRRVGVILVSQSNKKALDSRIFVVVNLLNGGSSNTQLLQAYSDHEKD